MDTRQHPDGLDRPPKGAGFTSQVEVPITRIVNLLTRRNIDAARKNHEHEWDEAFAALSEPIKVEIPKVVRDKPTMLKRIVRFSEDERERLATLATFVNHGLFASDRHGSGGFTDGLMEVGERITPKATSVKDDGCTCDECTCGRN